MREPAVRALPPRVAALAGLVFLAGAAGAAEHTVELGVRSDAEYTDNVDFQTRDETDASSYVLTPELGYTAAGERSNLEIDLALPFRRFSEGRLDSDDQSLSASGSRTLERGSLNFSAGTRRDSTRADLDATGILPRIAERRVTNDLGVSWARMLGERNQISVGVSGTDARYNTESEAQFDDFENRAAQIGWTRVLNEKTSVLVTLGGSRFESERIGCLDGRIVSNESDTLSLQAGVTRAITDRLHAEVTAGVREVDSALLGPFFVNFGDGTCFDLSGSRAFDDTGQLYNVNLAYTGERLEWNASVGRTLNPTGIGLLELDEITGDVSYRLNQYLDLRFLARYYDNQSTEPGSDYSREFYRVTPHVRWRFARSWWLDGGVEFRSQEFATSVDRADATIVYLSLVYRTAPLPVFR
jgi:hypothetical protein